MDTTLIDNKNHLECNGVYVYTARSILNAAKTTGATSFPVKIGSSYGENSTIKSRVFDQEKSAKTALNPFEEIVLLRVFPSTDALTKEKLIQRILKSDGHHIKSDPSGREWFDVSLEEIDRRAKDLGIVDSTAVFRNSQESIDDSSAASASSAEEKSSGPSKKALRIRLLKESRELKKAYGMDFFFTTSDGIIHPIRVDSEGKFWNEKGESFRSPSSVAKSISGKEEAGWNVLKTSEGVNLDTICKREGYEHVTVDPAFDTLFRG